MTDQLPLADVKILDLMWAMAGPAATRMLADYGATVVRVESTRRFDATRTVGPFHNGQPGPESSGLFFNMNAGKQLITLDLAKEAGRTVMLDLVRWADVVTEAFSPKAMRAWGFDYESLRRVKPDVIMLSTCLMGQSGPLAQFAGFGNLAAAISGFTNLAGWPGRQPAGPFGAYTDYIAPWFNAAAVLAALDYRRRTGRGQHIDLSQAEASLHFLGPALLDYTVNGRVWQGDGNRDLNYAPHGVYPAAGTDRWIAIAVTNNEQWQALCAVMGRPDLLRDERCATPGGRLDEGPRPPPRRSGAAGAWRAGQRGPYAARTVRRPATYAPRSLRRARAPDAREDYGRRITFPTLAYAGPGCGLGGHSGARQPIRAADNPRVQRGTRH